MNTDTNTDTADPRPALQGKKSPHYDGRYRLYTVADVPFDRFPEYPDGPALVTVGEWGVSYHSLCRMFSSPSVVANDDGLVELHIYQAGASFGQVQRHDLYGTKYPTRRDASRAAYEAGCLGFMVYESGAARYGLPADD